MNCQQPHQAPSPGDKSEVIRTNFTQQSIQRKLQIQQPQHATTFDCWNLHNLTLTNSDHLRERSQRIYHKI